MTVFLVDRPLEDRFEFVAEINPRVYRLRGLIGKKIERRIEILARNDLVYKPKEPACASMHF